MADRRQAVVLIHGIGEQEPMQNLRALVETVWGRNKDAKHPHAKAGTWTHPDDVSGGFELRRIAASRTKDDVLTDFFEFYWAHMMAGTDLGHVRSWAATLLWRNPFALAPNFRLAWLAMWIAALLIVGLAIVATVGIGGGQSAPLWLGGLALAATAVWGAVEALLRNVVGDAARYLQPNPGNIDVRHRIREAGVKLLDALHERGYDRIVVVGHSLGSVIGYDMLRHGWARRRLDFPADAEPAEQEQALAAIEALAMATPFDPVAYRAAQASYFTALQVAKMPWRVTDFVTLGSPLTHADVLLAVDAQTLKRRQEERELPTCPPALDGAGFHFTLRLPPLPGKQRVRLREVPDHGAVFAPVRWTNLYFPTRRLLWGDPIGGPLAPLFGAGISDVPVTTTRNGGRLSHTEYWNTESDMVAGTHVEALWKALDL